MSDMKAKAREEAEAKVAPFLRESVGMPPPNVYIYKAEATALLAAEIERRLLAEAVIEAAEKVRRIAHSDTRTEWEAMQEFDTALAAYRAHGGTA